MFLFRFFFTFLFFCFNTIFSSEYPYRDISKPPFQLPDNVRIIQSSPQRTGSTLIYNILQYLFEDKPGFYNSDEKKVIKRHTQNSLHEDEYIVTTIRNPLNAVTSMMIYREKSDDNKVLLINKKTLDKYANEYIFTYLKFYILYNRTSKKILVLRYEDFINDFEYIYSNLEAFFHISINFETRGLINKFFNIEAMKALSSEYEKGECHPSIAIFGNHINEVDWRKNIPVEFHDYLLEKFRPILNLYNYNP